MTDAHDDALSEFFEDNLITGVIREVKSGKEGTVLCCRAAARTGRELLAAKIYRSTEHRMFHNSAVYREGRYVADRRIRRAIANKSRAGRAYEAHSWVNEEFDTLRLLHGAGAAVPEPVSRTGQAILMSYVGDIDAPAPPLQHAEIAPEEADQLFRRLLREVELWLACGRVHADLSAFNILIWEGAPTVIDFPQAVDPEVNGNARALLARDLANLCRFFARYGIRADPDSLADGMWRRQGPRLW